MSEEDDLLARKRVWLNKEKAKALNSIASLNERISQIDAETDLLVYKRTFPGYVSHRTTGQFRYSRQPNHELETEHEWLMEFEGGREIRIWCQCGPLARAESVLRMLSEPS